jgi:hypothetical protein
MKDTSSILILIVISIFVGAILIYIFVFRVTPDEVPQFVQAWVTTQIPGDPFSSNEPRVITKDTICKLHAVIAGKKKGSKDITYFTNAAQLRLDGQEIPSQKIERWQKQWGNVRIIWSKIEPMAGSFTTLSHPKKPKVLYRANFCDKWPFIWELEAEVDPNKEEPSPGVEQQEKSEFEEFEKGLGTMRYTIYAVLYWGENHVVPIRKVKAPDVESYDDLGITDEVTRLSVKEDYSFIGTLRSLHNIPYVKFDVPDKHRIYRIKRLIGFDSIGSIMATLMLMDYRDLGNYDLNTLYKNTFVLYDDVYLAKDNFYYSANNKYKRIKFDEKGISVGDIIISGDHVGVISRDIGSEGLPNEYFDYADSILHCYEAPLKEDYISQAFLSNFTILRLKAKE